MKILRNVGIGAAALTLAALAAAILVVRSDRFRNWARQELIAQLEDATGGRAEIGSLSLDLWPVSATVTKLVIHGNEPAGSAPYLRADRVQVSVQLVSTHGLFHISYLGIERPRANILVFADGSTNVPRPKPRASKSNQTPLQTVVDLAVGHFQLSNGSVRFNSRQQDFDLSGQSLRVQLWYDLPRQGYRGEISLAPLYVLRGRNTPVNFRLTVPVVLDRDRISFSNARIETVQSRVRIDGSIENLDDPKTSAHLQGRVALADLKNAGNLQIPAGTRGLPRDVQLDVDATVAGNSIEVANARIAYGASSILASGKLQDPSGNGSLQFETNLALAELGRLTGQAMRPDGLVRVKGKAKLDAQRNYDVRAFVDSQGVSLQQGGQRVRNVSLTTGAHLTPHRLDLEGFRIGAFGAEVAGNASLQDFSRYAVNASLRHLDLETAMRQLGQAGIGYGGTVSGEVAAQGDLKAPGTRNMAGSARLAIAPGRGGIPVSGSLSAEYRGDTQILRVNQSFVTLPHTRLTMNGSVENRLSISLDTADLRDFSPLLGPAPAVTLNGSHANLAAGVTGRLSAPEINGHLAVGRFGVEGRQFDGLAADVSASSSRAELASGTLRRGTMQAQFRGAVGLRNWKLEQDRPLSADASVRNADLADVLALSGSSPGGYSGALSADLHVSGSLANPQGSANVTVANGTLDGEPIDSLRAQVNLTDRLVTVTNTQLVSGPSQIVLTAEFQHPRDRFNTGQVHAHIASNQVDLGRLRAVQNLRPNSAGILQLNADVTGDLRDSNSGGTTEFVPSNVAADVSGRGLRIEGQNYGDFTGTARTSGQGVTYSLSSNFASSRIQVKGNTKLAAGYQTDADASIGGLAIERVLAVLKRNDIRAKGMLSANAHVSGTLDRPEGSLDVTVDRAVFDDEPVSCLHARVQYLATGIDVPQFEISAGNSTLDASVHYDHPAGSLQTGEVQFKINRGQVDLAGLRTVQKMRPGLAGMLQLTASGAARLSNSEPQVLARDVNLNFAGKGIAVDGRSLGDLTLTAATSGGAVNFALDSNLAGSAIQGKGRAQLAGDYPVEAQLSFRNVTWKGLEPLLGSSSTEDAEFDAATDGEVTVNGPALRSDGMNGRLAIQRLQFTATAAGTRKQTVTVQNQGPIVLALDHGAARIESLHLSGPQTDVQAQGTVSLGARTVNASLNARTDLSLLQRFRRSITSSGQLLANATVRGTLAKPLMNGKIELRAASLNVANVPVGLSNANGAIELAGNTASFRNLNGQVGGGKVTLSGFASYSETLRMALSLNAKQVRVVLQPGVDTVADADVRLTGRTGASVVSGTVTLDQINYSPQSDIGAILTRAGPPVQTSSTGSALLDNMKLDIQVRTSSGTAVQASVGQNLHLDANLRILGTASTPGVTGRVAITEGTLVFFSSKYTVNTGTISFFNPIRIQPILDLSLATQTQGVDVTLHVTGPIDNMQLSYTSDPPLPFQQIVTLLATGQTPTSDPTILANQPAQPPQTFQQMGETAVVSKALADPIANRLQRVFGITQLSVNPTFAGNSDLPQAQLSLQQQVTKALTLTYATVVNDPNAQVVSGNLQINPHWSALAMRDQNGIFTLKLIYKKQFR